MRGLAGSRLIYPGSACALHQTWFSRLRLDDAQRLGLHILAVCARLPKTLFPVAALMYRHWLSRHNSLQCPSRCPLLICTGSILIYRDRAPATLRAVGIGFLLLPLVFIIGSPYVLLDFEHFWRDFTRIVGQFTATGVNVPEYFLVDHSTGLAYLLIYTGLFALGIPAIAAALLSFYVVWSRRPRGNLFKDNSLCLHWLLIALVLLLYGLAALRTIRPGHSDNLLLLILPFAALLSAIGADWLASVMKLPSRVAWPLVALVLIIQPLVLSIQVVKMFSQPDTRDVMLEWVHSNIPYGSRFFLNGSYNLPLMRRCTLTRTARPMLPSCRPAETLII